MSEEILQEKDEQASDDSTRIWDPHFWNQLRIHHSTVWPAWDVKFAAVFGGAAALFIYFIPAKYISCMVQDLLPPMMGILATLIAFVFAGLVFFASFHADDEYILFLGRYAPKAYSGLLFLFRWNAAAGITTIIAGLFVYLTSYSSGFSGEITGWLYPVVLFPFFFLFFYTILSVGNLFGTLAWHGMDKLQKYIKWEKEKDGAEPESVKTASND